MEKKEDTQYFGTIVETFDSAIQKKFDDVIKEGLDGFEEVGKKLTERIKGELIKRLTNEYNFERDYKNLIGMSWIWTFIKIEDYEEFKEFLRYVKWERYDMNESLLPVLYKVLDKNGFAPYRDRYRLSASCGVEFQWKLKDFGKCAPGTVGFYEEQGVFKKEEK